MALMSECRQDFSLRGFELLIILRLAQTADVAELADAQPSGGCDRKVEEVQLLSSAPLSNQMRSSSLLAFVAVCIAFSAHGQLVQPAAPHKSADDVNNKTVSFPGASFDSLPQLTHATAESPLNRKHVRLKDVSSNQLEWRSLSLGAVKTKNLPQSNFVAKRAAISTQRREFHVIKTSNAPITNRQIRAFTPGGEDELRRQLNTPH
jgi:hypothetical protein